MTRSGDGPAPLPPGSAEPMDVVARGGMTMGASTAIVLLLAVPTTAVLVRSLGVERYGALAFTLALTALVSTIADLGLGNAITRMSAFTEQARETGWARSGIVLATISGSIAAVACIGIAMSLQPPTRDVLLTASALPLVMTARSAMAAHLRARRRIVLVESSTALNQILYSAGAIAMVVIGIATAPRIAALRVIALAVVTLMLIPTWRRLAASSDRSTGTWRQLLAFSLPLLLAGISWVVLQRSDVIMLGFFRGPHAVGSYSPILQVVDLASVVMYAVGAYFLPVASGLVARGGLAELRWLYATVAKWGIVLVAPLLASLVVAPRPLLHALFGSVGATPRASLVARVLALGYGATVVTGQNWYSLMALGKSKTLGALSAAGLVANVAVNAALIPWLGSLGAAIGTSAVYLVLNVAVSYLAWKDARVHFLRLDVLAVLATASVAGGVCALLVRGFGWNESLIGWLFTAIVVGIASLVVWAITSSAEERRSLIFPLLRTRSSFRAKRAPSRRSPS